MNIRVLVLHRTHVAGHSPTRGAPRRLPAKRLRGSAILRGAPRDAYDRCLLALLGALRDGLDAEERKLLAEAALGAPRLPDAAIAFLGDLCESSDHVALGLGALRDVATRRPAARDRCLRRALELTRRPDVAPEVR